MAKNINNYSFEITHYRTVEDGKMKLTKCDPPFVVSNLDAFRSKMRDILKVKHIFLNYIIH